MNRKFRLTGVAVAGFVLGIVVLLLFGPTMMNDFVEYWAAGALNLSGRNPYDPVLMLELQRSVGYAGDRALLMLNPPPVLTLVMPFGALPYRPAALLWLLLNTAALVWSCTILWDLAGGPRRLRWVAYICGVVFLPTLLALLLGQISILLLLGLEFLVAADIFRTVAVTPDARSVAVLAGIVAIRMFLSFSLELEITGRWPWQKQPQPAGAPATSRDVKEL